MTTPLSGNDAAQRIQERFPDAVAEYDDTTVVVNDHDLAGIAGFLKEDPDLGFDYLNAVTGVDYPEYFEVVYHLTSLRHNHSLVLKSRCSDRENPLLPSVTPVWRGAELQEREVYDLMGIGFAGHPNLKRIFLWEGFPGHPLRKDWENDIQQT